MREFRLGDLPAGEFRLTWEGRDAAGREVPAGVYLLRLTSSSGTTTTRAALIR